MSGLLSEYSFNAENEVDGFESDLEELEESWTDVITEYEGMSNRDKIQQETIWELLITERNYLRKIRVIIVVSPIIVISSIICCINSLLHVATEHLGKNKK